MALTVRLGVAEVALIQGVLADRTDKVSRGLLDKLERTELLGSKKKARTGLPVQAALAAFRSVLGNRLVVPANPGPPWWGQMANGLSRSGWTASDCVTIAKNAGVEWKGYIKAESLVRQGDVLLARAQQPLPGMKNEAPAGPVALGEDDYQ